MRHETSEREGGPASAKAKLAIRPIFDAGFCILRVFFHASRQQHDFQGECSFSQDSIVHHSKIIPCCPAASG